MNKNRMTIEELRTLTLPVTLECDDGELRSCAKKIEVLFVGKSLLLVKDNYGTEGILDAKDDNLKHYPSQVSQPRTVVFKEWLDKNLRKRILVTNEGYTIDGTKTSFFDDHFHAWTGYEIEVEVPSDWRGKDEL